MNICPATIIFVAAMLSASCSDKPATERESGTSDVRREAEAESAGGEERRPDEDQIAEDCAAFVRATKVVPARAASAPSAECPTCLAGGTDALSFRQMKTDAVSCSGDTCDVTVTIRAFFNQGSGERIDGGLTGWIPPEQRSAYLRGQTPAGEQTFGVHISYKRRGGRWRAVEFDRAAGG